MRFSIPTFLSRFRRRSSDPTHPRTSAESQVEDLQGMEEKTEERKAYDEAAYEGHQHALKNQFGTSSHGGDNPSREKNP